ncbi:hypothetical protein EYF80_000637 [Liparis tanakae]|uniref:Uncharacterized protein n=1 Tax=Liparis tanakae TaxID=230148 RepID=A0A4Z2JGF2_9TELE|nr:hypothetical protein EYF80_000637 [Liparis tanakae]
MESEGRPSGTTVMSGDVLCRLVPTCSLWCRYQEITEVGRRSHSKLTVTLLSHLPSRTPPPHPHPHPHHHHHHHHTQPSPPPSPHSCASSTMPHRPSLCYALISPGVLLAQDDKWEGEASQAWALWRGSGRGSH